MNIFFIVSIICFALCLVMFFYLKWYIKTRATSDGLEEHRTEVAKLIAEINLVTDRNLQLIEDSISKLKKISEDTEKRIEEYKNAVEITPSPNNLYTNLGRGIRSALKNPEGQPPSPSPRLQTEHPSKSPQLSLVTTEVIYEPPVRVETKTAAKAPPPVQKPSSRKQIRNAIDSLANEGVSPEEIASRLEISIAQVNFALNLRKTKR